MKHLKSSGGLGGGRAARPPDGRRSDASNRGAIKSLYKL